MISDVLAAFARAATKTRPTWTYEHVVPARDPAGERLVVTTALPLGDVWVFNASGNQVAVYVDPFDFGPIAPSSAVDLIALLERGTFECHVSGRILRSLTITVSVRGELYTSERALGEAYDEWEQTGTFI